MKLYEQVKENVETGIIIIVYYDKIRFNDSINSVAKQREGEKSSVCTNTSALGKLLLLLVCVMHSVLYVLMAILQHDYVLLFYN